MNAELPELSDELAASLLAAVDCAAATSDGEDENLRAKSDAMGVTSDSASSNSSRGRGRRPRSANQRKYSKKLARRRELEDQVAALEAQAATLATTAGQHGGAAAVHEFLRALTEEKAMPRTRAELEALFRTALRAKMLLREENATLRRQFMASTQLHLRLGDLLLAEHTLCMAHASHFAILKPLTPDKCVEKHAEMQPIVMSVINSTASASSASTGSVCGWQEDRAVESGKFRFLLRKPFHGTRAREVCDQTFAFLLDPAVLSRFYSESLNVRLRIMQRVDEDNVVFFEELVLVNTPAARVVSKSILLMSRIPIDNGFRICMRCLDVNEVPVKMRDEEWDENGDAIPKEPEPKNSMVEELWKSRLWWIQIDDDDDGGCVVSYAGLVPVAGSTVWFLMGEVLVNAIRWEMQMKGSPFGLRA